MLLNGVYIVLELDNNDVSIRYLTCSGEDFDNGITSSLYDIENDRCLVNAITCLNGYEFDDFIDLLSMEGFGYTESYGSSDYGGLPVFAYEL